jgi:hypothetical protein
MAGTPGRAAAEQHGAGVTRSVNRRGARVAAPTPEEFPMAALPPHSDLPAPAVDADALLATLRNALDAHADDDADPRGGTPAAAHC